MTVETVWIVLTGELDDNDDVVDGFVHAVYISGDEAKAHAAFATSLGDSSDRTVYWVESFDLRLGKFDPDDLEAL